MGGLGNSFSDSSCLLPSRTSGTPPYIRDPHLSTRASLSAVNLSTGSTGRQLSASANSNSDPMLISHQYPESGSVLLVQQRAPIHTSPLQPPENSSLKSPKQQRQMSTVQLRPHTMHSIPPGDSMPPQHTEETCSTGLHS